MLKVEMLRNQRDRVDVGLKKRNWSEEKLVIIDQIIVLDDQRKEVQTALETELSEMNNLSKAIGELMKNKAIDEANSLKVRVGLLKDSSKIKEEMLKSLKEELEEHLYTIPNIPHESVPFGIGADDNMVYQDFTGVMPTLPPNALPHWEIGEKYNLFDLKLGVKVTGSGFVVYRGQGAKLQRALINYFLDFNTKAGYEEILPPHLVNEDSATATGQLPDKEGQMYYCEKDDLYLIPTSEVPVTNILRDDILPDHLIPYCMTSYTPCFRREAGSYGAHVKGLNRVHQFDKVEIVRVEKPERSYEALQEMVAHVARLMESLELPYRILRLCGGDMGFASAMTYDFEVWSAGQERWLEVSSVSNFETFQSNRLKLRYRDEDNNMQLLHTLNGSSLALARIVAALLENNQTEEGIRIPEVLRNFFGAEFIN
ncbi:MAG: serine--tRNA ligase [Saprospiraceae bacterium]|jgi:seryl-tRNA synthetase|uniref:serine--tRNA ligase n=1 Tax=Candidatus Brachybacter algidus TaxID=2982024 RepID=UPI001B3E4D89|nr:serine--tRNA ligase [Candidatus Brachybacter algidus]MBP7306542.1 serine--tRNA ligase [Saprospiraceae bacterium]MBK6374821.1 serine--tRNA ligase [Candidatus Brachybacter algidus]MBK6450602.1 serine--tRNA ligase [Candidatus Brachybacter algidus]MBK7605402.1 serine--tRNA ligase [Candidatus Brachybacter algidus]MBK8356410.1 serine--tRNA ligase [Candidatus Brachybacter algidus]